MNFDKNCKLFPLLFGSDVLISKFLCSYHEIRDDIHVVYESIEVQCLSEFG